MFRALTMRSAMIDSRWIRALGACLVGLLVLLPVVSAHGTALDDYVAAPDASYTFNITNTTVGTGYTLYTVAMTSQTWQSPSEVTPNLWQHNIVMCVPDTVTRDKALLMVGGGTYGSVPTVDEELTGWNGSVNTDLALSTGSVVAAVANVPCQPLYFVGDTAYYRAEDSLIAKTFREYLDGAGDDWPALLPMVKSAVRAMDTIESVALSQKSVTVNDFVLTGASKRGWTSWLTAAVDDRVSAIAPAVINVLNMDEQMKYHKMVYQDVTAGVIGGYSSAVRDYVYEGVFDDMDSPEFQALLEIVDPYEYRDRLDMPKFMLNATDDQFFVPDSCQFFLGNLSGENYIRFQPNEDHGVSASGYNTINQFYKAMVNGTDLPDFSWTVEPDGSIHLTTVDTPTSVKLWQATNPNNRDFREPTGIIWTDSVLTESEPGVYVASVSTPASGYTGFLIEMTYDVGGESMIFTTEANVIPAVVQPGDANFDGVVDDLDASILASNWQLQSGATWGMGDFNRDGKVTDADAAIMAAHWTMPEGAPIPEPGTLALLATGAVLLLCRRFRGVSMRAAG